MSNYGTRIPGSTSSARIAIQSLVDVASYIDLQPPTESGQTLLYDSATGLWYNSFIPLNDLTDVTIAGVATGQLLVYNGAQWVNQFLALSQLSDVTVPITPLTSDQVLFYNGATWTNGKVPIQSLSNVSIVGPVNNETLLYDSTLFGGTGGWKNSLMALTLLSDVLVAAPSNGQFLKFNGTNWVNAAAALDDLSDVVVPNNSPVTPLAANQVLYYDGTKWTNGNVPLSSLQSVSLGALSAGQILGYNGTNWTNLSFNFSTLGDVDVTGVVNFQTITYQTSPSAKWRPAPMLIDSGADYTRISPTNAASGLVLSTTGTTPFIAANVPDGSITNGNNRGNYAVDLQILRNAATQVASGANSAIMGGENNTVSGSLSTVCGGKGNTVSDARSTIAGGESNTISSSGSYNGILGGLSNTISSTSAFSGICGGSSNSISGTSNACIMGGQNNTISSQATGTCVTGFNITASATSTGVARFICGQYNDDVNALPAGGGTARIFTVGNGTAVSRLNIFSVDNLGNIRLASGAAVFNTGADYAEFFESLDGEAIPVGTTVSLVDEKIVPSTETSEVIGVVSATAGFVGNSAEEEWFYRCQRNEAGGVMYEIIDGVEEIPQGDGTVIKRPFKRKQPLINPEYDPSMPYVGRNDRKEWHKIALMGQVFIKKGQKTSPYWRKLKDVSENFEKWLI